MPSIRPKGGENQTPLPLNAINLNYQSIVNTQYFFYSQCAHLNHHRIMVSKCFLHSLHHVLLIIKKRYLLHCHFKKQKFFLPFYFFTFKSLIVCVFPVMPVTTAIPLSRISTFSYLASTITFPFNVITPQCLGICSKAQ